MPHFIDESCPSVLEKTKNSKSDFVLYSTQQLSMASYLNLDLTRLQEIQMNEEKYQNDDELSKSVFLNRLLDNSLTHVD